MNRTQRKILGVGLLAAAARLVIVPTDSPKWYNELLPSPPVWDVPSTSNVSAGFLLASLLVIGLTAAALFVLNGGPEEKADQLP